MKRIIIRSTVVACFAILSFALVINSPLAYAVEDEVEQTPETTQEERIEQAQQTAKEKQKAAQEKREELQTKATEKKAAAEKRLSEAKLKVCEERTEEITNTMARMNERGQKHLELFTTISERVQEFYVQKGNTLDTYDSLVMAVDDAKVTAQSAVDATKAASEEFTCDGEDPKGTLEVRKANMEVQIAALKEYRTAIKNLIVGVKSVQTTPTVNQSTEGNN